MKKVLQNPAVSAAFLAVAFLLIYNPVTKMPYTFLIIILFILFSSFLISGNVRELNFKKIGIKEIRIVIFYFLLFELSVDFVFQPLVNKIFNEPSDYSYFAKLEGNTPAYFKMLWKMWLSAAIGEELLFRSFAFARLNSITKNAPLKILITSILFCIPHFYQGWPGLVLTFIWCLLFGYLYNRYKNIWINIIVHGLIDSLFLTVIYFGYSGLYNFQW